MIDYSGFAFPKPGKKRKRTRRFTDKTTGEARIVYSKYGWQKLRITTWEANPQPSCSLCGVTIERFSDFTLDHEKPRGMGGGSRNDAASNLNPAHFWCNRDKGSKRNVGGCELNTDRITRETGRLSSEEVDLVATVAGNFMSPCDERKVILRLVETIRAQERNTLGYLANAAARDLPEDWYISVHVEKDSGYVNLFHHGDDVEYPGYDESIENQFRHALERAQQTMPEEPTH